MISERPILRFLIPLLGGALVGLSLPPLGAWPLGVLGLGLVLFSLTGRSVGGRLAAGLLAGLGQFGIGLYWVTQFSVAGYLALLLVESAVIALACCLAPPGGLARLPAAAAAVTIAEWARESWPFGGLPLGSAALGQVGGPFQFDARIGGPLLVVFAAALAGGSLFELLAEAVRRSDRPRNSENHLVRSISFFLVSVCLAGAGAAVLPGGTVRPLSVGIVQGGGRRGLSQLQVPASTVLRAALRETARLRGRLDLVVWPEDVVSMGTEQFVGSAVEKALARLARQHRATLLAGVTEDVGTARFKNEVVAFSPRGRLVATFEKVHRVPFGEYVPFRALVRHLANLSDVPRDAIAGHGSGMIHTPAGRLALLVSYEVFFADRARSGVRAGGRLLVVPTNTSSYSSQQAPSQELAASRLQALSFGRYLLQAAPTGYSAVVAPSGAVIAESALSRPAVIERRVSLLSGVTPYEAAGDMPVLAAGGALLVAGWILLLATEDPPPSSTPRFADLRRSPRRRRRRRR